MASKRASDTWRKLMQWYGARLGDQYGAKVPSEWAIAIDRADNDRLEVALATIKREHVKHPPTLGEFEAAIPPKHFVDAEPSIASRLCEFAMQRKRLCDHQVSQPWNYFGPVEEFISKHRHNEVIRHPRIAGVQIPGCKPCGRPAIRVLESELR